MKLGIYIFTLLLFSLSISGQTVISLGDLKSGDESSLPSFDHYAVWHNDQLIFTIDADGTGSEPYVYEGDSLRLLKDIRSGGGGSEPQNYYIVNDVLLFTADDGVHGREWWTTDGTVEGTQMLIDIFPGDEDGVYEGSFNTFEHFVIHDGLLYFSGADVENNFELWATDGTPDGTRMVRNIAPDNNVFNTSSYPDNFIIFQDEIYFAADNALWKSNGTEAGTEMIYNEVYPGDFSFDPGDLYTNGDYILFSENPGVWISDGTTSGTKILKEIGWASTNSDENRFIAINDFVIFPAKDEEHGEELWRTDGTEEGTVLVTDLNPGPNGYAPQNKIVFDGYVYYKGDNGSSGKEMFRTDGTAEGTVQFTDISSGSSSSFFLPTSIVSDGNYMYFNGSKNDPELWFSDGDFITEVNVNDALASYPLDFFPFDDKLLFFGRTNSTGYEPYIFDAYILDADNDGYGPDVDCDDNNASVNPGQDEVAYNGLDDDCNPDTKDDDLDGDGYPLAEDCNDLDSLINPGVEEIVGNDVDENCDGEIGTSSTINIEGKPIKVYPTLTNGIITIEGELPKLQVHMYNISGKRVGTYYSQTIDVNHFDTGLYYLIIDVGNKASTPIKIIKY